VAADGRADVAQGPSAPDHRGQRRGTSTRARLWTLERQRWAAESGLRVGVSLSDDTTTSAGLRMQAALDAGPLSTGIKVSDAEMKRLQIDRAPVHGEWNDTLRPHRHAQSETKITRTSSNIFLDGS
jgi:Rhodopirellula transposase DDE domain